ncbi:unnamed protein product, partial [Arabidopsis halleri]
MYKNVFYNSTPRSDGNSISHVFEVMKICRFAPEVFPIFKEVP